MFKEKTRKAFTLLRFFNDVVVIYLSFVIGYALKFKFFIHLSEVTQYPKAQVETYLEALWVIAIFWILAFILNGLYREYRGTLSWMNEVTAINKAVFLATLETFALTFIFPNLPQSKYVIVYAAIVAVILLIISRAVINGLKNYLHKRNIGNKKAIIIGASKIGQELAEKMLLYPELGFNYVGSLCEKKPSHLNYHLKDNFIKLGSLKSYKQAITKHKAEALFITDEDVKQSELVEILSFCREHKVHLRFTPSRYQFKTGSLDFDEMDGIPLLGISRVTFNSLKLFFKRLLDLLFVIPLIVITSPIMAVMAFLIKRDSAGPAIYKQERVTSKGKIFMLMKFRSMRSGSEKKGKPVLATKDQKDRTTKIGYFMRKTSLDELPQLFNVLKGEMTLIGPRPERPFFHKKYIKTIPNWTDRLKVPAGITGWAQINGRAQLSTEPEEKLAYDLFYIDNWSLMFDLKIILRTITTVLLQRNVY